MRIEGGKMFCYHAWLPWSKVLVTHNGGHKQQWRNCRKCNIAQFRTLRWDEQTEVSAINEALDEVKGAESAPPGTD